MNVNFEVGNCLMVNPTLGSCTASVLDHTDPQADRTRRSSSSCQASWVCLDTPASSA
jgi:hypothetical protein